MNTASMSDTDKIRLALTQAIQEKEWHIRQNKREQPGLSLVHPMLNPQMIAQGQALAQSLIARCKEKIETQPMVFLGQVALCSFGLGLILSSRRSGNLQAKDTQ